MQSGGPAGRGVSEDDADAGASTSLVVPGNARHDAELTGLFLTGPLPMHATSGGVRGVPPGRPVEGLGLATRDHDASGLAPGLTERLSHGGPDGAGFVALSKIGGSLVSVTLASSPSARPLGRAWALSAKVVATGRRSVSRLGAVRSCSIAAVRGYQPRSGAGDPVNFHRGIVAGLLDGGQARHGLDGALGGCRGPSPRVRRGEGLSDEAFRLQTARSRAKSGRSRRRLVIGCYE